MWSNFPMNSQRTLKEFFGYLVGYIAEYILKETSMSGSGILWTHCRVLFEFDPKVIAGQIVIKLSAHCKSDHNVPSDHFVSELMGTFEKRSQFAQWVKCGQIDGCQELIFETLFFRSFYLTFHIPSLYFHSH